MICPLHPVTHAPLRSWVLDSAAWHVLTKVSPAQCKAYFAAVFHAFFYCTKKCRVPMKATILILRVIRSCQTLTTSLSMTMGSLQLAPKSCEGVMSKSNLRTLAYTHSFVDELLYPPCVPSRTIRDMQINNVVIARFQSTEGRISLEITLIPYARV